MREPGGPVRLCETCAYHRTQYRTTKRDLRTTNPRVPGTRSDQQYAATTLFRLRKLVGAEVVKRQDGRLSIASAECWVDCRALERLLNSAVQDSHSLVERVKRLYAGHFCSAKTTPRGHCIFESTCTSRW